MKNWIVFATFLLLSISMLAQKQQLSILKTGARPDGKTNNTRAIQSAIDQVSKLGGGSVIVPAGRFVTGPIFLKSGVTLELQGGAKVLASENRLDYGTAEALALINCISQNNVSIVGVGEIDGRAPELIKSIEAILQKQKGKEGSTKGPAESDRPKLLYFQESKDITVKGISLVNGTGWIQDYNRCNGVTIDSITVISLSYWNNDGIDISNSKNVRITNSTINSSDDAIVLKSEGSVVDSCVNVYVSNCRLRSSANAFKIGTGSKGGFRNVQVEKLFVYDTYRSAIAIETVDGGFVENVEVSEVQAVNSGNAFFIRLGHRNKDDQYSSLRNVKISKCRIRIPANKPDSGYAYEGPLLRYPPGFIPQKGVFTSVSPWNDRLKDPAATRYEHNVFPASITGLPGHPVQDISIEDVDITYLGGGDSSLAFFPIDSLDQVTEASSAYPEFSMFGEIPVWGLYVRHAAGLTIRNVRISNRKPDYRSPMIFDDVQNLELLRVFVQPKNGSVPIILKKVPDPIIKDLSKPDSIQLRYIK